MKTAHMQNAFEKSKRFNADPATHAPCIECGAPVEREKITAEVVCCSASCFRRFKARMKSEGLHPVEVAERWFVDLFGIERGRATPYKRKLLPIVEAYLLYITGTLTQVEQYRNEGILESNCY